MTKAVISRVIRSVPLEGSYLFSSIRWLKRKPLQPYSDEPTVKHPVYDRVPVLYSSQPSLSTERMEDDPFGCHVDYFA